MEESLLDEVEEENETGGRVSVGAEVTVENEFKWLSSQVITKIWQKVKERSKKKKKLDLPCKGENATLAQICWKISAF